MELSTEEKKKLVKFLISLSPVNEVALVAEDLQKIVKTSDIPKAYFEDCVRAFNENNKVFFADGTKKLIVCAEARLEDDTYLCPDSGEEVSVSHQKEKIVKWKKTTFKLSDFVESARIAVAKNVKPYVKKAYYKERSALAVYGKEDGSIVVVVSGMNSNLKNFWFFCYFWIF